MKSLLPVNAGVDYPDECSARPHGNQLVGTDVAGYANPGFNGIDDTVMPGLFNDILRA